MIGPDEETLDDNPSDNDYDDNLDPSEMVSEDEPIDFYDDVQADADVLKNAGWGTDEDYGYADEVL
jgi:hypothetical protein